MNRIIRELHPDKTLIHQTQDENGNVYVYISDVLYLMGVADRKAREDSEQEYNQLKEDVGKSCPPCYELTLRNEKAQERIAELEGLLSMLKANLNTINYQAIGNELTDKHLEILINLENVIEEALKKKEVED